MICNTVSDWLDCDSDCMGVWDWLAPSSSKPLVPYRTLAILMYMQLMCYPLQWHAHLGGLDLDKEK